jgi:hypothetical protein
LRATLAAAGIARADLGIEQSRTGDCMGLKLILIDFV